MLNAACSHKDCISEAPSCSHAWDWADWWMLHSQSQTQNQRQQQHICNPWHGAEISRPLHSANKIGAGPSSQEGKDVLQVRLHVGALNVQARSADTTLMSDLFMATTWAAWLWTCNLPLFAISTVFSLPVQLELVGLLAELPCHLPCHFCTICFEVKCPCCSAFCCRLQPVTNNLVGEMNPRSVGIFMGRHT